MNPTILGPSVRAAREAAKLSQNAVAQALGMNRMYYSLFEAGRYLISDDEESALHEYLSAKGIPLQIRERAAQQTSRSESGYDLGEVDPDRDRTGAAELLLDAVWSFASSTGQHSKRTAVAVNEAVSVLMGLDFQELCHIAESRETTTEGLPNVTEFASLPLEKRQLWESRAVGMLICDALYGESWRAVQCKVLIQAGEMLRRRVSANDWEVRERNWFESDESYRPDLRCHLSRYLADAASQRRAPALA